MSVRAFPEPIHFLEQFVSADNNTEQQKLVHKQRPRAPMMAISAERLGQEKIYVMCQERMQRGNQHLARRIAAERSMQGKTDAFLLFNLDTVVQQFVRWRAQLPRVKPFYAVKCNDDQVLLATLAKLGVGFDCASRHEIDLVLNNGFGLPEDIVYANTCKSPEFIQHAESKGVNRFTFDCVEELVKMKQEHSNPEMILRIDVTDASAKRPLDVKFGCDPASDAPRLLRAAQQMAMRVIGISFHVGSGCQNPLVYRQAIGIARKLFVLGQQLGHRMYVLDLGGGYPGCEEERGFFEEVAKVIREALDEFFPDDSTDSGNESEQECHLIEELAEPVDAKYKLEIIAEPGRYFASSPSSVCANIVGATRVRAQKLTKKADDMAGEGHKDAFMYFLNDGVYGSFSCLSSHLFTKVPNGRPLFPRKGDTKKFLSVVWGPTCDSRDQVEQLCLKPRLEPGDWLFYSDMGAYTRVTATKFNGFSRPSDVYYVVGSRTWEALENMSMMTRDELA